MTKGRENLNTYIHTAHTRKEEYKCTTDFSLRNIYNVQIDAQQQHLPPSHTHPPSVYLSYHTVSLLALSTLVSRPKYINLTPTTGRLSTPHKPIHPPPPSQIHHCYSVPSHPCLCLSHQYQPTDSTPSCNQKIQREGQSKNRTKEIERKIQSRLTNPHETKTGIIQGDVGGFPVKRLTRKTKERKR